MKRSDLHRRSVPYQGLEACAPGPGVKDDLRVYFRQLYSKYDDLLMRCARSRIAQNRLAVDPEDVVQDIYARALGHVKGKMDEGHERAFLLTVLHNALMDDGRRAGSRQKVAEPAVLEELSYLECDPEFDCKELLLRAIMECGGPVVLEDPLAYAELLWSTEHGRLKAFAKATNVSAETIRKRVHDLRLAIQAWFKTHGKLAELRLLPAMA